MAMCVIAYIRDSCSGSFPGAMHAASAALLAFAFQVVTESAPADVVRTRGRHRARPIVKVVGFIGSPFGNPTIRASARRVLTVSSTFSELAS
jgi:hypothetical protein